MRSKCLVFSSLMILLFLLNSCDFMRTLAGRPTSDEIALMSAELVDRSIADQLRADSLRRSEEPQVEIVEESYDQALDSLRKDVAIVMTPSRLGGSTELLDKHYYIIIGSFKEESNALKLQAQASGSGFDAQIINFRNGYHAVGICAADNPRVVVKSLTSARTQNFCPKDAWLLINE